MSTEENKKYYVYALIDNRDEDPAMWKPFYIGKGTGKRFKDHLTETEESNSNRHKNYKIRAIRRAGKEPEIYFFKKEMSEIDAYELEKFLIKFFGRANIDNDGILTNICEDNRPPNFKGKTYEEIMGRDKANKLREERSLFFKGKTKSSKHRENLRAAKLGKPIYAARGLEKSEEHRRNLSAALKGRFVGDKNPFYGMKHTEDSLEKMKLSMFGKGHEPWNKGKTMPEEIRQKNGGSKKVRCIDTKEEFFSVNKAKEKYPNADIAACCRGNQKTAGNLRWEYINTKEKN